jgi:hypothetical protein
MKRVSQRRKGRNSFSFDAKRRNEIERLAKHVGAADTEDFDRYLIAWYWHNPQSKDPLWSLMYAAGRMGGRLTEAQASAITEEASIMRRYRKPDPLARFLGLKYAVRQKLQIRTIGSIDIGKRARTVLRKRKNRIDHERKRRELGMKPWSQSLSRTRPWEELGMSRRTWERHRNKARDAKVSAVSLNTAEDTLATPQVEARVAEAGLRPASKQGGCASSQTATIGAAGGYASLPLELRLLALGLPLSTEYRAAA